MFGNVSKEPLEKIQEELERIEIVYPSLLASVEVARIAEPDSLDDKLDLSGVDTDIEDAIALEISRRLLRRDRDARSLTEASHLIEALNRVMQLREAVRLRAFEENEAYEAGVIASHGIPVDEPRSRTEVLNHHRQFYGALSARWGRITNTRPGSVTGDSSLSLRLLGQIGVVDHSTLGGTTLEYLLQTFWTGVYLPEIKIPSFDPEMDSFWRSLDSKSRAAMLQEIYQTIVLWQIASPAARESSGPGLYSSLVWGLQIPIEADRTQNYARSTLEKKIKALRQVWSKILKTEPRALLWAAHTLVPHANPDLVLDAMLGFASDSDWEDLRSKPGPKPEPRQLSLWICSRCQNEYQPGDSSHDSPLAKELDRTVNFSDIGAFKDHHRVVAGLPGLANSWNRLMCNNEVRGEKCWKMGGVLVPTFKEVQDK